jgi:arylsulfatase A-like enzyme
MARYMDKLIGKVVNTLDELAIRDRTIVFFCGDNGSSQGALAWGRQMPGGKGKVSELGVHTPFIANCPGLVPAGRTCDDLIDLSDVLPTLAELAGVRVPDAVTLDGLSFAGSLLGRPTGPRREWIFTQTDSRRVLRDKRFARYSDGRLYDVLADPFEERDLSDSTDQGIVASRSRLKRIMDTLPGDAPMTGFPPTYAQTKMVPDLPAGSGKYKPMEPSSSQESKAKRPKTARKKNRVPAGTGGKTRR